MRFAAYLLLATIPPLPDQVGAIKGWLLRHIQNKYGGHLISADKSSRARTAPGLKATCNHQSLSLRQPWCRP